MVTTKPTARPVNPRFSSGPCAKPPTWKLDDLRDAPLGRSHRASVGKSKLAEAIDLTVAFIQLDRENAKYLDRPYKWLAKVGLDWVKAQVVDDLENRVALIARFDLSQSIYQRDPWADRATPKAQMGFTPLADLTQEAAE